MWFGACTSSIGTWMQIVAQGWLIYRLSHSAFLLALDQFLGGIPIFLFSLIGGVVADRMERRKILLGSQYMQMASAGCSRSGGDRLVHVWHILCLSFVSGFAQAFGGPAYSGADSHPGRPRGHAQRHRAEFDPVQLAVTIGPALAGQALGEAGREVVLRAERAFFPGAHRSLSMIRRPVSAAKHHRVDVHQPEAGHQVRSQAAVDGSADRAGVLHDRAEHAHAHLHSRLRQRHLPSRSGNLRQPAFADGIGSICGSLMVASAGNIKRGGCLGGLICLGAGIAGLPFRSRCR
jgi:hypothetical protein